MRFTITSLTYLTAFASAGPLVARQFANTTASAAPSSLHPSSHSSSSTWSSAFLSTSSRPSASPVPTSSRSSSSSISAASKSAASNGPSVPGFGATGLLPSNGTNNIGPDSITNPGRLPNATGPGVGSTTTVVAPAAKPTVTVYLAEVCVTAINGVTIVVDVYGNPVTTTVGGQAYTISPAAKTTVTTIQGTQTVVVVSPATSTAIPAVTTTVYVGDSVSTVVYVPSAGPTSTAGAPSPAKTVAPTYQYTATSSICECPLPTTVTQYITVQTSARASATATASATITAPANCAYPGVAAYPTLFPGLILPVQAKNPSTAYGTKYIAEINADQEVVFQFNVQKTGSCSVALALPPVSQLTTSSWSVSGNGDFSLAKLPASVDQSVTFAKLPTALNYTSFPVTQGGTKVIGSSFDCVAGTTATFVLKSTNGASLSFFEDYNCPAVGLLLIEA